jgi:transcriptional regulator with XRE-family HTH domain
MTRTSRQEWGKRVRQWRASGLSARAFAEQTGINVGTLRHWAWQLAHERREPEDRPAFVEVIAQRSADAGIEIAVRDGIRICVPGGFDEATLRRVVAVLESR